MTVFLSSLFSVPCRILLISCVFALVACQQHDETHPIKEQIETPKVQNTAVDLTLMCQNIEKNMAEINDQRTTFALEQINQDLKVCLPLLKLEQQKVLLKLSLEMYDDFLQVTRTPAQQIAFERYAFDMAQHPTIHQSHFEQLTPRDQYLLKHQGQAYVEVVDTGNEKLTYRRSPDYLARIFAPYMPEAEKVFIENLAHQNIEPALQNQSLQIEPFEVARRALFWESYIHQYPQSSYLNDAKLLLAQYRYFLFIGSPKSLVSEDYHDQYSVRASSWEEIEKLAQSNDSELSKLAKKFIHFYHMSDEERRQNMHAKKSENAEQQLIDYLNLIRPHSHKNCLTDAICL